MRLLHYIPVYAPAWRWGGPVRSVSGLCEELVRQGHEVTVFTTNAGLEDDPTIPTDRSVTRNGVTVHYFPALHGYGIRSPALEAAVAARAGEFDLIHVTAIWQRTGPAACQAARAAGVPYVISPRGALGPYSWRRGRLKKTVYYWLKERAGLRRASGFHYTSKMEAGECERFRFGRPSCIVPNAVDFSFWHREAEAGEAWRSARGFAADETVLLYAGRLHHKKGLELLPEVVRLCRDAGISVKLVLLGVEEDDTGSLIRRQSDDLGIAALVSILPAVSPEELRAVYSAADLFVMPSRHENFGNVAVEAAACGCPVLLSDQIGVAQELAACGKGLVLPRHAEEWAAAIKVGGRAAAQNAVSESMEQFSLGAVAGELAGFYGSCIASEDYCQAS